MNILLRTHTRQIVTTLFLFLALLLVMHLVVAVAHLFLHREFGAFTVLFDMDREANMPALFNVMLFFLGALLFFLLGRTSQGRDRWPWMLMTFIFLFLALDEGSQIHEKLMLITLRLMGSTGTSREDMGFLFYAWIIPYFIGVVVLAIVLFPWLIRLEPQLRWGLMLSGTVYVFGAIFMESYSGKVAEDIIKYPWDPASKPWMPCHAYISGQCMLYADAWYVTLYTIEEVMEMSGLILCAGFLMRGLERRQAKVTLEIGKP